MRNSPCGTPKARDWDSPSCATIPVRGFVIYESLTPVVVSPPRKGVGSQGDTADASPGGAGPDSRGLMELTVFFVATRCREGLTAPGHLHPNSNFRTGIVKGGLSSWPMAGTRWEISKTHISLFF